MKKPDAVVFDLGKVLLDFDYQRLAKNIIHSCGVPLDELVRIVNQSELLLRYESGLMTSQEFFEAVKSASKFAGAFHDFEPMFGDIFTPIPAMIGLQQRLRKRGVPTYIFSNTNEIAIKHVRKSYPFFSGFTGYVFSYEHRAMKPHPKIYEVVETETGRAGDQLLYIDDRLENIEQGRARGWRTIHHSDAEPTVRKVEELLLK